MAKRPRKTPEPWRSLAKDATPEELIAAGYQFEEQLLALPSDDLTEPALMPVDPLHSPTDDIETIEELAAFLHREVTQISEQPEGPRGRLDLFLPIAGLTIEAAHVWLARHGIRERPELPEPFSTIAQAQRALHRLLAFISGLRPLDDTGDQSPNDREFRPAREFVGQHGIETHSQLTRFLDGHADEIRTRKPSLRRREINLMDWATYWSKRGKLEWEVMDSAEKSAKERRALEAAVRERRPRKRRTKSLP
jgi:hypothetical protein